jgi:hypothetical protein
MTDAGARVRLERRRASYARALRFHRSWRPFSPAVQKLTELIRDIDQQLNALDARQRVS